MALECVPNAVGAHKYLTNSSLGFCGRGAGFRGNDLGFCGRRQDFTGSLLDFAGGGQDFAEAVQDNAGDVWISWEQRRLGGNETGFRGRSAGFSGSEPERCGNDLEFRGNAGDNGGSLRLNLRCVLAWADIPSAWSADRDGIIPAFPLLGFFPEKCEFNH